MNRFVRLLSLNYCLEVKRVGRENSGLTVTCEYPDVKFRGGVSRTYVCSFSPPPLLKVSEQIRGADSAPSSSWMQRKRAEAKKSNPVAL